MKLVNLVLLKEKTNVTHVIQMPEETSKTEDVIVKIMLLLLDPKNVISQMKSTINQILIKLSSMDFGLVTENVKKSKKTDASI